MADRPRSVVAVNGPDQRGADVGALPRGQRHLGEPVPAEPVAELGIGDAIGEGLGVVATDPVVPVGG
jgi:hypothetical protein